MAFLDPETGSLTIQIVYDGAPFSGKTASLQALGRLLDRKLISHENEDGRTLFFDWLDYEGGICLGRPIRCRVVSVPGQPELLNRRSVILAAADAVVFVVDSRREKLADSITHFADLEQRLAQRRRQIPGIIQWNKRDQTSALDLGDLVTRFDAGDRCTMETVAVEGRGIRETFVCAVGEAVRALKASGQLYAARDENATQEFQLPSAERLLEILRDHESGAAEESLRAH